MMKAKIPLVLEPHPRWPVLISSFNQFSRTLPANEQSSLRAARPHAAECN